MSRIEQQELDIIRENLHLDPIHDHWTATYAFKQDPSVLYDNKGQVIQLLQKQEKRLSRSKVYADKYREQFQDLFDPQILTEISKEENLKYDGPVFYVSTHKVFKEGSSSTPIRLVINPSLKYKGIGLNDIVIKGPNALNDLFGIQVRFRKWKYGLVADLRKMFHSIHTTKKENTCVEMFGEI